MNIQPITFNPQNLKVIRLRGFNLEKMNPIKKAVIKPLGNIKPLARNF